MVSKMLPTPMVYELSCLQNSVMVYKWSFFNRKKYNMWCSSRNYSMAPAVSSVNKDLPLATTFLPASL